MPELIGNLLFEYLDKFQAYRRLSVPRNTKM